MLPRVLEPEAMDGPEEARDYDAMDHRAVNDRFVADFLNACGGNAGGLVLDVGTGTARIPIALCRQSPSADVLGIDLAEAMLEVGRKNVAEAGLESRIRLERHDARRIAAADGSFAAVVSNTIIHHIPEPGPIFAEMVRLVAPGGNLFVRDLGAAGFAGTAGGARRTICGPRSARRQGVVRRFPPRRLHARRDSSVSGRLANPGGSR